MIKVRNVGKPGKCIEMFRHTSVTFKFCFAVASTLLMLTPAHTVCLVVLCRRDINAVALSSCRIDVEQKMVAVVDKTNKN